MFKLVNGEEELRNEIKALNLSGLLDHIIYSELN